MLIRSAPPWLIDDPSCHHRGRPSGSAAHRPPSDCSQCSSRCRLCRSLGGSAVGHWWLTREAVGSAMHLCLLGPFEMVVESRPVRLTGRGERALVAVLALSPGRVVADTTIIEQLWS